MDLRRRRGSGLSGWRKALDMTSHHAVVCARDARNSNSDPATCSRVCASVTTFNDAKCVAGSEGLKRMQGRRITISSGQVFNRFTAINECVSDDGNRRWEFKCSCGNVVAKRVSDVVRGVIKSCGCQLIESATTHGFFAGRHGNMRLMPYPIRKIYKAWVNMKDRCYNTHYKGYADYGGRGIVVCSEWRSDFPAFLKCIGDPPSPQHSVGRIETNGNYEPGNVRWETGIQQGSNRRTNVLITYKGETLCVAEWARRFDLRHDLINRRFHKGIDGDALFAKAPRSKG